MSPSKANVNPMSHVGAQSPELCAAHSSTRGPVSHGSCVHVCLRGHRRPWFLAGSLLLAGLVKRTAKEQARV